MDGRTLRADHRWPSLLEVHTLRVVSSRATNATGHAGGSASEAARAGLRRMR